MDNDISTMSLSLYEKDPVGEGSTNLLCIKKRRELQQRGVALVLWLSLVLNYCLGQRFLVLSFVFKASFTLGLESFVEIWEGEKLQGQRSIACVLVFSYKHEAKQYLLKTYGILDKDSHDLKETISFFTTSP